MQAYPHQYEVQATAKSEGSVTIASQGLASLTTAPPREFGGPGDQWSPETLFVAAAVDCLILTFRAVARASNLPWLDIDCRAEGVLDRVEGVTRFTELHLHARLTLPAGADIERGRRLLEKAEKGCLVTNSLKLEPVLAADVVTAAPPGT
jgi:organic hydroperoxide reductase OsmC/OhrA